MKKLQLNKKTVAQMDRVEMSNVKGGIDIGVCFVSCANGTRKSKSCCGSGCTKPQEPAPNPLEQIENGLQQQG